MVALKCKECHVGIERKVGERRGRKEDEVSRAKEGREERKKNLTEPKEPPVEVAAEREREKERLEVAALE